ncbi:hypothetical protein AGROH133_04361 [Agrobacterium tumefaciens]|nr:hypothetical protein AGROH133_04361 [Agrobacterium tumefaciens]
MTRAVSEAKADGKTTIRSSRAMTTRDLVLISLFSAIIIALGLLPPITLGFIPVPITAQSLGVIWPVSCWGRNAARSRFF